MGWSVLMLVVGLGVLTWGAELLVRGASKLALAANISPLVIGLTIVAFGTSAPELTVSGYSAVRGQGDIALGNVIGSNIFNLLFILGVSALITPLIVAQQLIRWDVPLMMVASCVMGLLAWDGSLSRIDGVILLMGLLSYILLALRKGRQESAAVAAEYRDEFGGPPPRSGRQLAIYFGLTAVGLIMLITGSKWFTDGAVSIARLFGMSELVIGLTIVAIGTSLPEVATSIAAAIKGERDIAVGNVVGSNLFNLLGVLGTASVLAPDGINIAANALAFDIPVMIAVAFVTLPVLFTGYVITRTEGLLLLAYFLAYNGFVVWAAQQQDPSLQGGFISLAIVLPLLITALVLVISRANIRRATLSFPDDAA